MPTKKVTKPAKVARTPQTSKTKVASKKSTSGQAMRSLRISKSQTPFMTVAPSKQTLYWIILGVVVIGFTFWILRLQSDIDSLYDSISTNDSVTIN